MNATLPQSHSHPAGVIGRLQDIESDLATKQNDYEKAADDRARMVRDWEKRLALHLKQANGPNAEMRKAIALVAAIEQDDLYERLSDAEARYDSLKVVVKVLTDRASIGQSILRSQGRQ